MIIIVKVSNAEVMNKENLFAQIGAAVSTHVLKTSDVEPVVSVCEQTFATPSVGPV